MVGFKNPWVKSGMIILGLDPGIERMGYALVDASPVFVKLISCGMITTKKDENLSRRLFQIFNDLQDLIEKHKPLVLLTEKLFFSKNVKTAEGIYKVKGIIELLCAKYDLIFYEYTPLQVKTAVTGYGKASKKQIKKAVELILNLGELPQEDDVIDALAICICGTNNLKFFEKMIKG